MRYKWRKQRTKWNLLDDPDFYGDQIDPRRVYMITVGGTATDGDYSFDYSYLDADGVEVSGTISFTANAPGDDNTDIATGLAAAFEAESDLDDYGNATSTTALVLVVRTYLGRDLILSNPVAPAPGTLHIEGNGFVEADGQTNQVTSQFSTERPLDFAVQGRVGVSLLPIDANGDPVAIGQTADIQMIDVADRSTRRELDAPAMVNGSAVVTAVTMASPEFAEMAGSEGFAVRVSGVLLAGTAIGFEIWVKEAAS